MDPSGYWMDTKSVAHPVSFDPTPTVTVDKMTYDGGHWVDISTDDRGAYSFASSTGWKADKIVWHPGATTSVTSGNVVGAGDATVTKVSDTKTTHTGSFKESSGRTVTLKGSCTKQ